MGLKTNLDEGRGGVSSSNGRYPPGEGVGQGRPDRGRPNSPTQSHSHSQAQSREVLSDHQSVPIAESWCVTKVKNHKKIINLFYICSLL